MVNTNELEVLKKYEDAEWKVLRGGAPDFLCLKVDDGKIEDFMFVEVKTKDSNLTYEQAIYKEVLESLGAKYRVEVVNTHSKPIHPTSDQPQPSQTNPYQSRPDHSTPHHSNSKPIVQASPLHPKPDQANPHQFQKGDINERKKT